MSGKTKKSISYKTAITISRRVGSPLSIILHTLFFMSSFIFVLLGFPLDRMLLIITTVVSLEAIYLALFLQLTVNYQGHHIKEVRDDIEDIQEDIEELTEDDQDDIKTA